MFELIVSKLYRMKRRILYPHNRDKFLYFLHYNYRKKAAIKKNDCKIFFDTTTAVSKHMFYPKIDKKMLPEEFILNELINSGSDKSCFLDIGANIGYFSVIFAKLFPESDVHAIEIDPFLIEQIAKNKSINKIGNLSVICSAVWDQGGHLLTFNPIKGNEKTTNSIELYQSGDVIVSSITLDQYCHSFSLMPDIVKIDVEGAEVRVLSGMGDYINSIRTLFVEIHPDFLPRFKNTLEDLRTVLSSADFEVKLIDLHTVNPNPRCIKLEDITKITMNSMLICQRK